MSKERDEFIKKYSQAVINATKGKKILPSITMAQMLIESGNKQGVPGKGITFTKANNAFGIKKGIGWKGQTLSLPTPKDASKINVFRVYNSIQDSISDHTDFLLKNSRYKKAGLFDVTTPEAQASALDKAKYSESPTYGKTLLAIINGYNLRELDNQKAKAVSASPRKKKVVFALTGTALLLTGLGFAYNKYYK